MIKEAYLAGVKTALDQANVNIDDSDTIIDMVRRGWPDPQKKAEREADKIKRRALGKNVSEKIRMSKHSPDTNAGS